MKSGTKERNTLTTIKELIHRKEKSPKEHYKGGGNSNESALKHPQPTITQSPIVSQSLLPNEIFMKQQQMQSQTNSTIFPK